MNNFSIFSGSSHESLVQQVCSHVGSPKGSINLGYFPDGEIYAQILENVRGRSVFIIQSIVEKPNEYLMELLIIIDALKRASAKQIIPVIPYFGYSRQDRKDKPRVAISAKLVADLLEKAGATRILTMDLHADQVQGFFNIPVDNLYAKPVLLQALSQLPQEETVIVGPDVGSIKLARAFANGIGAHLAVADKRRISSMEVETTTIIGEVNNKRVILVDDICSTANTLIGAAEACQKAGAKEVYAAVSHCLCLPHAIKKLQRSTIKKIFVSNTIPGTTYLTSNQFEVVSVAKILAKAIECIMSNSSIASLFHEGKRTLEQEVVLH